MAGDAVTLTCCRPVADVPAKSRTNGKRNEFDVRCPRW
jgi:hypothetical protein